MINIALFLVYFTLLNVPIAFLRYLLDNSESTKILGSLFAILVALAAIMMILIIKL